MRKQDFSLHLPKTQRTIRQIGMYWAMRLPKKKASEKLKPECFCFAQHTMDRIMNRVQSGARTALLVHDFGCQLVAPLIEKGITDITIGINTDHLNDSENLYNFTVSYIKNTFKQFNLKFKKVKELNEMQFDLIIANPPYGPIGANITKTIVKNIKFNQFINLLPSNDYMRNDDKDLYKYADNLEVIKEGFVGMDATVTTHIAELSRHNKDITAPEFEISQYTDVHLAKYFQANIKRALGDIADYDNGARRLIDWTIEKTFIMNDRTPANKNPFNTGTNMEYSWNRLYLLDPTVVMDYTAFLKYNKERATAVGKTENHFVGILFDNAKAKTNLSNFIYSTEGNAFIKRVLRATNKDGWLDLIYWFPRPTGGWSRSWTVEEILADYGYTKDEIQEVMAAL